MRLVWNEHNGVDLRTWFVERLPVPEPRENWPDDQCRAVAFVAADDAIAGVLMFHHWNPLYRRVQASVVSADPRWMRARACWAEAFDYVFKTLNCVKVYSETPAANMRALRFVQAVGLKPKAVLEHHFGPGLHGVYSDRDVWTHYGEQAPRTLTAADWPQLMAWVKDHVERAANTYAH